MQLRKIRIWRSSRRGSFSVFDMMMAPSTMQRIGEIVEIDRLLRRIDRRDAVEDFAEASIQVPHRLGGEIAYFAIEQSFLIANACNQAARMTVGQIGHYFGEQLQGNQESLQRIVG